MEKVKIIEKDKSGQDVFIGDLFPITINSVRPQYCYVKVIKDDSELGYEVEDANGERCWNPFAVVHNNVKVGNVIDNRNIFLTKKRHN
jgi:hypothetical protein